jgi:hypothetical protein
MVLAERLRRWLRRAASEPVETGERDYLPELVATEQVRVVAGGVDPSVGLSEFATALLTVARDGDTAARNAALDALGAAAARWWLAVDDALRQRWWWAPRWSRSVAVDLVDGELDMLRLVVAGCHHSGRIREAVVVRLADRQHPAAVAVLALRACDWVAEVRQAARTVVAGWPSPPDGPALTTLAELAFALATRREGAWLAERVDEMLRDLPEQRLEPLLSARDRRVRRAAYRVAIAAGRLGIDRLTRAAVRDHDLPIRTMCARVAVAAAADPGQLQALLASRTALVRAEALHALIVGGDLAVAEAALTDRHPLVREIAQEALRRAGSDPAEHYRRLAAQVPPEPSVIAGLGETGGPDDAAVVARWLSHPRARGRVEAIRALRRLGMVAPAVLVPLLRDESAAVTRQAVATLRRNVGAVDPRELRALLGPSNPSHVRFAGYRLLTGGDVWQRVATDLRLIDDPDQRLRVSSRADLATWLEREAATTYRGPGRDRAAEIDHLIEQVRPILGEDKARLLRFHAGLSSTA